MVNRALCHKVPQVYRLCQNEPASESKSGERKRGVKGKEKWSRGRREGEFREFSTFSLTEFTNPSPPSSSLISSPPLLPAFCVTLLGLAQEWSWRKRGQEEEEAEEEAEEEEESCVAEECGWEREHGYKRLALPLCRCDVTTQEFPPSFPSRPDLQTLLFLLNFSESLLLSFPAK